MEYKSLKIMYACIFYDTVQFGQWKQALKPMCIKNLKQKIYVFCSRVIWSHFFPLFFSDDNNDAIGCITKIMFL